MLLADKVVLITGSAAGVGRECALACAREGAAVMIADIDGAKAEVTAHEVGPKAAATVCDVTDRASVERAVEATLAQFGRLDALHNNAGISTPSKPLDETTEEEWDRLM